MNSKNNQTKKRGKGSDGPTVDQAIAARADELAEKQRRQLYLVSIERLVDAEIAAAASRMFVLRPELTAEQFALRCRHIWLEMAAKVNLPLPKRIPL